MGRSAVVLLASKKSEGSVCNGSMEANNSQNSICNTQLNVEWYVMRVTYQRELVARRLLEEMGIVCFVPTEKVKRRKPAGGYQMREVAKLHNYIFIHSSLSALQEIKTTKIPYLRYMMAKGDDGKPAPQFVPADQMEHFMEICRSEGVRFLEPDLDLKTGDRVRILVGPLRGVEGVYMRTSARHEKRVVVQIEGVAAVATAAYRTSEVEKVNGNGN